MGRQPLEPPHLLIGPSAPSQALLPTEYCLVTKKVGRCRGSFPRWYYDPKEQICKSFVYGGCLGNKNNYLREEECKLACRDVQGGPLHGGFGAQVTFPQGRWSLFPSQGGGDESPPFPGPPSAHLCLSPLTSLFSLSQVPPRKGAIQVGFAPFPSPLTPATSPAHIMSTPLTKLLLPNPVLPS